MIIELLLSFNFVCAWKLLDWFVKTFIYFIKFQFLSAAKRGQNFANWSKIGFAEKVVIYTVSNFGVIYLVYFVEFQSITIETLYGNGMPDALRL